MLNQLRQTLARRLAHRKKRSDAARLHWLLERLEDRNMLSASFGPMPHGHGADYPQHLAVYEPQAVSPARGPAPALRGLQDRLALACGVEDSPLVNDALEPPPRIQSYVTSGSFYPTTEHYIFAPSLVREVTFSLPLLAEPEFCGPPTVLSSPPIHYSTVVVERVIPSAVSIKPPAAARSPIVRSIGLPDVAIPSATAVQLFASSVSGLPATAQILARDNSAVAMLAATARDLAFQSYAPNLLLLATSASNDRANLGTVIKENAQSVTVDSFIRPYQRSSVDPIVDAIDAVTQEREAVNTVLQELRDVDAPLPGNIPTDAASAVGQSVSGQDLNVQIDLLQTENVADEMPAGEVQGGMVLLQSTGDANESNFDLTPIYAEHVEHFNMPASMETSVGLFQAMDVAADETTYSESARPTGSAVEPQSQIPIDDHLQSQREQPTSRKAAALIGATTLTGALLWINRNAGQSDPQQSAAQKLRVRRGTASPRVGTRPFRLGI